MTSQALDHGNLAAKVGRKGGIIIDTEKWKQTLSTKGIQVAHKGGVSHATFHTPAKDNVYFINVYQVTASKAAGNAHHAAEERQVTHR